MIIVIDGPAGSGKSSTARAVAHRLDIEYLDSGALYRTATLLYLQRDKHKKRFVDALKKADIQFSYQAKAFEVSLNGESVTGAIRSSRINKEVSGVASMPQVRSFVNNMMRKVVAKGKYIAEGRDLGTAVFPDAAIKFYMFAGLEVRAKRRYQELKKDDHEVSLEQVKENIRVRDRKDTEREDDPLKKAQDAIEVDTSNLTFEQQVDKICSIITEKLNKNVT